MKQYDLLIIGAGTAGLSAAKEAAKHTDNFALIESGPKGTLCARTGCMPSKALIEAAHAYHERTKFENFGIKGAETLSVDIPAVMQRIRSLRNRFVESVKDDMRGFEVIEGKAVFSEPNVLEVNGIKYKADAIILCTGSNPRIPDIFKDFKDDILTTDTLFEQKDLPKTLAVIGFGNVGAEMGQAIARLGVNVTAYQSGDAIAGISDPDINQTAQGLFDKELTLHLKCPVERVERKDGRFQLHSAVETLTVDGILVSAGRVPNLTGLGLEKIGVALDDKGIPEFDPDTLQIKDQPIYIAGDVNADRAIQHEAADEGKIAAQHALGKCNVQKRRTPLTITFTDPPIVQVGKPYAAIKGDNPIIGEASYRDQGRAIVEQENHGKARLYAAKDGCLLGAEMMSPAADHFGHLLALAIQEKLSIQSLLELPTYHPVLEEGLRTALGKMEKQRTQAA